MSLSTLPMLAKAPNRKRATEYLHASGAAAISIIERRYGQLRASSARWSRT